MKRNVQKVRIDKNSYLYKCSTHGCHMIMIMVNLSTRNFRKNTRDICEIYPRYVFVYS